MWEDFVKYNSIRTNFLKTFKAKLEIEVGEHLLPLFLQKYEESNSVFEAWLCALGYLDVIDRKTEVSKKTINKFSDYIENWWNDPSILKYLRSLFPEMMDSSYDIKRLETDVPKFSPLSIEEFYFITKGKYYLGYDLDEDLIKMKFYLKNQDLIETYMSEIMEYFLFRYDNFGVNVLCEYNAFPFGIHETRRLYYKKTKQIEFDYPREMYKYNIKELMRKYLDESINIKGTRIINIRGTNGSGKTTMVNSIYLDSLSKGQTEERTVMLTDKKLKAHKRYYDLLLDKKIILLGGYNSPYGTKGTDRVGDVHEIVQGILYLISNYPGWTIIIESATVSTSFWAYAILFSLLQTKGVEINIVHLWMTNWDFIVNNIKNRTKRKEGAKTPDYQGAIDKREILYKNHFRFSSILGKDSMMVMYPDMIGKDEMHIELNDVITNYTGRSLL